MNRKTVQQSHIVCGFFKRGSDCRRYNEPTHHEVAAVFLGEEGASPASRDIVVYPEIEHQKEYCTCHATLIECAIQFSFQKVTWAGIMT